MLPVRASKVLLCFWVNKGRLKSTTAMGKDRLTGERYVRVHAHGRGGMVCPSWWSRVLRIVAFIALLGMVEMAQGAGAEAAEKTQQAQPVHRDAWADVSSTFSHDQSGAVYCRAQ